MYFDIENPMKYSAEDLDFNFAIQLVEYSADPVTNKITLTDVTQQYDNRYFVMSARTWNNNGNQYDLGLLGFGTCSSMAAESQGAINPFPNVNATRKSKILQNAKCLDTQGAYFEGD